MQRPRRMTMQRTMILALAITLAGCSPGMSDLEEAARDAVAVRHSGEITTYEVDGLREPAVCGTVDGKRFLYRPATLAVEGDAAWSDGQFDALWKAWGCLISR